MSPMGHVYADTDRTTNPTQNTERCDDMKKMLKKVLCAGLLVVMSCTILPAQAANEDNPLFTDIYSFSYDYTNIPYYNVLRNRVVTECTGADKVLIRTDRFQVQVPAAYITVKCTSHDTNTTTISTTGTVGLQYLEGGRMPRQGEPVTFQMNLMNYSTSRQVKANGFFTAT